MYRTIHLRRQQIWPIFDLSTKELHRKPFLLTYTQKMNYHAQLITNKANHCSKKILYPSPYFMTSYFDDFFSSLPIFCLFSVSVSFMKKSLNEHLTISRKMYFDPRFVFSFDFCFLGELKVLKRRFEIIWPLAKSPLNSWKKLSNDKSLIMNVVISRKIYYDPRFFFLFAGCRWTFETFDV